MEFIKKQSKQFNDLVKNYLIKQYNLKIVRSINNLKCDKKHLVWSNNNTMIISNVIINSHYNLKLDPNKYSLVLILYRNLYYREQDKKNVCYLDLSTKVKLNNMFMKFSKKINLTENAIIISRKYYNKLDCLKKTFNCFDLVCIQKINSCENKREKVICKQDKKLLTNEITYETRRKFLYNLKMAIDSERCTLYIKDTIKNCIFLDIEYINDIYDDFKSFPISKDTSILCMIGMSYFGKDTEVLKYDNLIVKKLDVLDEYYLLKKFLEKLNENKNDDELFIFHWSHADKTILEKSLAKYDDLLEIYNQKKIKYIDLLKIVKESIVLESYSLKYVSKVLLEYTYESDCKNGLDAMCSIIINDQILNSNSIRRRYKSLNDFSNMRDIIQYNKIDTQLLYVILKKFIM